MILSAAKFESKIKKKINQVAIILSIQTKDTNPKGSKAIDRRHTPPHRWLHLCTKTSVTLSERIIYTKPEST